MARTKKSRSKKTSVKQSNKQTVTVKVNTTRRTTTSRRSEKASAAPSTHTTVIVPGYQNQNDLSNMLLHSRLDEIVNKQLFSAHQKYQQYVPQGRVDPADIRAQNDLNRVAERDLLAERVPLDQPQLQVSGKEIANQTEFAQADEPELHHQSTLAKVDMANAETSADIPYRGVDQGTQARVGKASKKAFYTGLRKGEPQPTDRVSLQGLDYTPWQKSRDLAVSDPVYQQRKAVREMVSTAVDNVVRKNDGVKVV